MSYIALARRYRPQRFDAVVGQSHVTDTLRQAIAGGRVAPAYLFTGPRGSGKTTVARIVAKAVNCDKPKDGEPDGQCEPCVTIAEGRSLDVQEIDGASNNSVDDVRLLRENVGYAASKPGKRKVYIVDEVHMLSGGAFNALLKTLEEPPPHVLFVFATTDPRRVPATVVSRCQRFDFRRLQTDEIRDRVTFISKKEKLQVEATAAFLVAKRADGSLRDALSLLDQVVSSCTGSIGPKQVAEILGLVPEEAYLDLTRAVLDRDAKRVLETLHGVLQSGVDASDFALGLVEHFRNLLLLDIDPALQSAVQLGDAHLGTAQELAVRFKIEDLLYLLNRAALLYEDVRRSPQPVVGLEAGLVEMGRFESRVVLAELLERLDGGPAPEPPAASAGGAASARRGATAPSSPSPAPSAGRRSGRPRGLDDSDSDGDAGVPSRSTRADESSPKPLAAPIPMLPASPSRIAARAATPDIAAGGPPPVPAHAAAQVTTGTFGAASIELETVLGRWHEFTNELRATKGFLAVCLSEGKPVRVAGGAIEVWFPREHAFHLHAVRDAIKTREIEPYLRTFFGKPVRLALAADETPPEGLPATASESESMPGEGAPGSAADEFRPGTTPGAEALDDRFESPGDAPSDKSPAKESALRGGSARLTPDDIARSRRSAIDDVVQATPGIEDIIQAFDGEVLEDRDA